MLKKCLQKQQNSGRQWLHFTTSSLLSDLLKGCPQQQLHQRCTSLAQHSQDSKHVHHQGMLSVSLSLASKVVAAPANHPSHIATASFNVKSVSSHRLISSCSSVHQKSSFPLFGTLRKNNTYPGCVGPHLPATSTQYHCLQRPSKLPNRSFTASQAKHSMHSTATCRAYVGESTPAAAEYHCNDFDWEELKQEAETLLADRHAQLKVSCKCAFILRNVQLRVTSPCRCIARLGRQTLC